MNFQDLFARYREMGVMAPQQSLDEQSFVRSQNLPTTWWTFLDNDPPDFSKDIPSLEKSGAGTKKENITFKLPTPNTFRPFAVSMDEEQEKSLSHDDEVEDLLQSLPPQQKLNLGLLKTNTLCKDYYKLTSNMIHALVMGIREFTDEEIAPSWQVAQLQGKVHQNNLSNAFLQGVMANKSKRFCNPFSSDDTHEDVTRSHVLREYTSDVKRGTSGSHSVQNTGEITEAPLPKEITIGERYSRDMDSISELRKLLWKQIFPFTHLGNSLDQRHDGDFEKKLKVTQESRMKILNPGGLVPGADNYNPALGQLCQISNISSPQHVDNRESNQDYSPPDSSEIELHKSDQHVIALEAFQAKPENSETECIESGCDHESETNEEKIDNDDNCAKQEDSSSNVLTDELKQLNDDHQVKNHHRISKDPCKGTENHLLKQSRSKCKKETRFEDSDPSEPERTSHLFKETKCCADGNLLVFDGDFKVVEQELESPREHAVCGPLDEKLKHNGKLKEQRVMRCKENVFPPRSSTKTWCIVGGFTTRSRTVLRS